MAAESSDSSNFDSDSDSDSESEEDPDLPSECADVEMIEAYLNHQLPLHVRRYVCGYLFNSENKLSTYD